MKGIIFMACLALVAKYTLANISDQCPDIDGPEDVLLPNPSDCGSFYKCLGGNGYIHFCPSGLHWSIELNRCEWPAIAKCNGTASKPTTQKPKPTTERPTECPEEDGPEDVLLPNPEDCGSFFKCWKGQPHLINCPWGQEWSIELNRCDYPEIAKCVASKPTTEKPTRCPAETGSQDVLLSNPADCGSFYKCLNGNPILILCPAGLHWNDKIQQCDYHFNAKCNELN